MSLIARGAILPPADSYRRCARAYAMPASTRALRVKAVAPRYVVCFVLCHSRQPVCSGSVRSASAAPYAAFFFAEYG